MKMVTNETTRRGLVAISGVLKELKSRGHDVLLIAMANPDIGLKYGSQPFMVDDNCNMLEVVSGLCDIHVMPQYNIEEIMRVTREYSAEIYLTKGDNMMPRDDYMCRAMNLMGRHIVCLQADSHMYVNPGWYSKGFMVSGNYWKSYLYGMGVSQDNITTVGSIKADHVYNNYSRKEPENIVFFDQMTYNIEQRVRIQYQLELLEDKLGMAYLIKLHPAWKEYRIPLEEIWPDVNSRHIVDTGDPYYLIERAAIVIIGYSSTGYEAMSIGIPTLLLNISNYQELYKDCGVDIYDVDKLSNTALDIINDNYDKIKLQTWMDNHYYCDGKSSSRIVDKLEELYNEYSSNTS